MSRRRARLRSPAGPSRGFGRTVAGFTLLELVAAMTLLAIVAVGFAATVNAGFRTVALSRQRQIASEAASARLEHLRSVPFEAVALGSAPTHVTDADHPNHLVAPGGGCYDVTGDGDDEPLVVDTADGAVLHLEDPVQVGNTLLEVYQYVTVPDAACGEPVAAPSRLRVTVVARYKTVNVEGVSRIVRASSIFTAGTVTFDPGGGDGDPPPPTTTTTSTTTTTLPPPPGDCPTATSGPEGSFALAGGAGSETGFTAGTSISVLFDLDEPDDCWPIRVRLSNDGTVWTDVLTYDPADPELDDPSASWALSDGDGTKTVHARVRDDVGNETDLGAESIVLDTVAPSVPNPLTRSVACQGVHRTVTLSWGTSSDLHFQGYRVYRSTDGSTWSQLTTAAIGPVSDTHRKNLDSVRYHVVGYDRAGNESDPTNVVALSRNECS